MGYDNELQNEYEGWHQPQPAPAASETGEEWSYFHDTDGYYYICRHGKIQLTIAKTNYEARAIEITTEHNSRRSQIAERERLAEALKQIHAALPNGIRLTRTETKIATIVADALNAIDQKGSGSE